MLKRMILYSLGGILLGVTALAAVNAYVGHKAKNFLYPDVKSVPGAHTALILGAKVYQGGRLSHMLEDRVLTGLELYRQGKVKKLLLSGDHGRKAYDEVNAMRNYLLKKGVPPQDIFMDHAGFNTYNSMYRARDVFQVQDVIVVTQEFHVPRSVYIARALGLDAVGVTADRRVYMRSTQLKSDSREILARVKAFLDVNRRVKPKFLGTEIPIQGDGRKTLG
ncbi:MAG: hypothetical protein GY801_42520 [bacterium]|nr:hypothetical protein [bacterium]